MENADAIYYEGVTNAASSAVAKALPKLWAAKAKAYAAAKAGMPPGPPLPRHALEESLDRANGRPTHRAILHRATSAPAKAKAAAAVAPGKVPLTDEERVMVITEVNNFQQVCCKAVIPLVTSLKRQRDGAETKLDVARSAANVATAVKTFDSTIDAVLEDFMDRTAA